MSEAHARDVAAIEEMTISYLGEPEATEARYGRSPAMDATFDIRKFLRRCRAS